MHLYLMGYRGSGKSTVGRQLAQHLGWPIIDTDEFIEQTAGCSIRQIFEVEGEVGFRDREQAAVTEVAHRTPACVVSLGGGAILRPANQAIITSTGKRVWLQASPELLYGRISGDHTTAERRPQLTQHAGYAEVVEILAAREPIYRRLAQLIVDTEQRTPDEVVLEIADWLKSSS